MTRILLLLGVSSMMLQVCSKQKQESPPAKEMVQTAATSREVPSLSQHSPTMAQTSLTLYGQDPREFPLGNQDAVTQLRSYPAPRYKPQHSLLPLFSWMDYNYLSNRYQRKLSEAQTVEAVISMQEELSGRFNYYIGLGNTTQAAQAYRATNPKFYLKSLIDLANAHPEWPVCINTLWAQTRPADAQYENGPAFVKRKNLSKAYYLRDEQDRWLDAKGNQAKTPTISLVAPEDFAVSDGSTQHLYLSRILDQLKRPLDFINENGEVGPPLMYWDAAKKDPHIKKNFEDDEEHRWYQYLSQRKLYYRETYRAHLMEDPRLANTLFSWYGVDGGGAPVRFNWDISRKIQSPIQGQYYSTPDFYPRSPERWNEDISAWKGFRWIGRSRIREIKSGDRLFSPFVAAGWSKDPTQNIRPSQWLALLKHLGVLGAEFYYAGYFTESLEEAGDPAQYVWQLTIPSYAQAVTSHFEEELRQGDLLKAPNGNPKIRYWTGEKKELVTARKHLSKPIYIISASINPESNKMGDVPDSVLVNTTIDNMKLRFWARKQGSVYRLDLQEPQKPIWTQLDRWHEIGHPANWSSNRYWDAWAFSKADGVELVTEQTNPKFEGDFSRVKTFASGQKKHAYQLNFEQAGESGRYDFYLTYRLASKQSAKVKLKINQQLIPTTEMKGSRDFIQIKINRSPIKLSSPNWEIQLEVPNGAMEIEALELILTS